MLAWDDVPERTFVAVVESKPDGWGRQKFSMFWRGWILGDGPEREGVRGQCFDAVLADVQARSEVQGWAFEVR